MINFLIAAAVSPPPDAGSYMVPMWLVMAVATPVIGGLTIAVVALWKTNSARMKEIISYKDEVINSYNSKFELAEKMVRTNEALKASVDALTKSVDNWGRVQ